jgi:hypothetical protein
VGNATKLMKCGPSHLVGHKSSTQDRYSLEGNQCVCADVRSVFEIMKKTTPGILTRPTSLEMLLAAITQVCAFSLPVRTRIPGSPTQGVAFSPRNSAHNCTKSSAVAFSPQCV